MTVSRSQVVYDIGLDNDRSIGEIVPIAQAAEEAGFDTLWIAEQHFGRGVVAIASAVAGATESLAVGFGVVSPFIRHPASIAMEFSTLVEQWGPRFKLAYGVAHHGSIRLDRLPADQVNGLEEAANATKTLLGGGVAYNGARLEHPVRHVRLFVGSMGLKTLKMSASVYDGALLGVMSSRNFINSRVDVIEESLADVGKSREDYEVAALVLTAVATDVTEAVEVARRSIAYYLLEIPDVTPRLIGSGLDPAEISAVQRDLSERAGHRGLAEASRMISEELVHALAVVGTPTQVAGKLSEYRYWGVDRVVAHHALGLQPSQSVAQLGDALSLKEGTLPRV